MITTRPLLLSIKPSYARAILDGTKTTELRNRRVAAGPGAIVILYATSPTKAVVGTARLMEIRWCEPAAAWDDASASLGLAKEAFDEYTAGRQTVSLLFLGNVTALDVPLPLADLRKGHDFQPPQSYRYVAAADPRPIQSLVAEHPRVEAPMHPPSVEVTIAHPLLVPS